MKKLILLLFALLPAFRLLAQKAELMVQSGHSSSIVITTFSPYDKYLASAGENGEVILWDVATGGQMAMFSTMDSFSPVKSFPTALAFSSDNRLLACGTNTGKLTVFDIETGLILHQIKLPEIINSLVFKPDNTVIWIASSSLFAYRLTNRQIETLFPVSMISAGYFDLPPTYFPSGPNLCCFDPLGKMYIFDPNGICISKEIRFVKPEQEKRLNRRENAVKRKKEKVKVLQKQLEKRHSSYLEFRKEKLVHKLEYLQTRSGYISYRRAKASSIAILNPEMNLVIKGKDNKLFAYSFQDRNYLYPIQGMYIDEVFKDVAICSVNNWIFAANSDGRLYVIHPENGRYERLKGHLSSINSLSLSSNQDMLASASDDRSILLWDTKTLKPLKRLYSRAFPVTCMSASNNGKWLILGDETGNIKKWETSNFRMPVTPLISNQYKITGLFFAGNDSLAVSISNDNKIRLLNINTGQILAKRHFVINFGTRPLKNSLLRKMGFYVEPNCLILSSAISHDGTLAAFGGEKLKMPQKNYYLRHKLKPLQIRKLPNLQLLDIVPGGRIAAFSPNNETLAVVRKNDITLYRINKQSIEKRPLQTIPYPTLAWGKTVLFYQSQNILINRNGGIEVVDISTGKSQWFLPPDADSIECFSINEKLQLLVTGHASGKVSFYHTGAATVLFSQMHHHKAKVLNIEISEAKNWIISSSEDATMGIWDAQSGNLLASFIPIDKDKRMAVIQGNYYYASREALSAIGFKAGTDFFPPEQFDLKFNRPDLVLSTLGLGNDTLRNVMYQAYLKRLAKSGFTEKSLGDALHLPRVEIIAADKIPIQTLKPNINIDFRCIDSLFLLNDFNIWVNEVPLLGSLGKNIANKNLHVFDTTYSVELNPGKNKIQISCMNQKGVESLKKTFYIQYDIKPPRPDLYLVVVSVSDYLDSRMNLKYAVKDGRDFTRLMNTAQNRFAHIYTDTFFNEAATVSNILQVREKLMKTRLNDQVILYFSGHGLLNKDLDFYYATYDIDFSFPELAGLPYSAIDKLLDSIPARNKLLLMDACHSGEVDKTDMVSDTVSKVLLADGSRGGLKSYTYRSSDSRLNSVIGLNNSFELMQELFTNLSRGNGAVVISAASGRGFALESPKWKNGVFTYSIISGIKTKMADFNKDKNISVSELRRYVFEQVQLLTHGHQRPTCRQETIEFDFIIW